MYSLLPFDLPTRFNIEKISCAGEWDKDQLRITLVEGDDQQERPSH